MIFKGCDTIKRYFLSIFLVLSILLTISVVSATETSNETLSLDKTPETQSNDNNIKKNDNSNVNEINSKKNDDKNIVSSVYKNKSINNESNVKQSITSNLSNEDKSINNTDIQAKKSTNNTNKTLNNTNISKEKTKIKVTMNSIEAYPYCNITIKANVKTSSGAKLNNNAPVVFKINGVTIGKTKVANGVASMKYTIPLWSADKYTMLCKVSGTSSTEPGNATSTLTLTQSKISVKMNSYTASPNSVITLKAYVKYPNGANVNNAPVVFKVNDKTINTVRTANGVASLKYTTPSKPGTYTLTAKVSKTTYSKYNETSSKLKVKEKSVIDIPELNFAKKNSKITLTAKITNTKGVKATSGNVAFKIDGKTIGNVNVTNGIAKITYNTSKLSNGIHNITVKYGGNSNLDSSNTTSHLRVQSTLKKYSYSQVLKKAEDTKNFIEKNNRLPNYISFGDDHVSTTDFLYLLCEVYGTNSSYYMGNFGQGTTSKTTSDGYKVNKDTYIKLANSLIESYAVNGRTPHNIKITSSITMNFDDTVYFFSRNIAYLYKNGVSPSYTTVTKIKKPSPTPSEFEPYLAVTANCQVNSTYIRNTVAKAIKGVSGTYNQAVAIFNYVNDHTSYLYYTNTRYGAIETLKRGYGNCVDMSHAVIAMMRTNMIPARYCHATCTFRSGLVTGHVWAEVYVNGKWYYCDATSSSNTFGHIVNWSKCTNLKKYASLPF